MCDIELFGLSYDSFRQFTNNEFGNNNTISYLQIEHVI